MGGACGVWASTAARGKFAYTWHTPRGPRATAANRHREPPPRTATENRRTAKGAEGAKDCLGTDRAAVPSLSIPGRRLCGVSSHSAFQRTANGEPRRREDAKNCLSGENSMNRLFARSRDADSVPQNATTPFEPRAARLAAVPSRPLRPLRSSLFTTLHCDGSAPPIEACRRPPRRPSR